MIPGRIGIDQLPVLSIAESDVQFETNISLGSGSQTKLLYTALRSSNNLLMNMPTRENTNPLFNLTGKVAIVTGGNGGIGLGIAVGLAGAGADIVIAARDPAKTSKAIHQIEALGRRAVSLPVDVSQEGPVKRMVADAADAMGSVDILVNNAGIATRSQPQDLHVEDWDQVIGVNLRSAFLACKEVHPHFVRQGGGKIINIGSLFSIFGSDNSPPYGASKGGLVQLTKSLAVFWAKDNIQANVLLPGWITTDMTSSLKTSGPERYKRITERIPSGRWGEPADLAGAGVFLASRASDYVTGSVLTVDGGYSSA